MELRLNNYLAYYEALASGKNIDMWGRPVFKPSVEQRADAIAEEQRKYLAAPLDRHGNKVGVSSAASQFRADLAALKLRKDKALGELAAVGRAEVLQEDLVELLKVVKKLSPSQKARRDAGLKIDYYNPLFNNIQLRFIHRAGTKFGMLTVEMHILDESGQVARISLNKIITAKLCTADFAVCVEWNTLFEIAKTYDKERVSIQYRDWIGRLVVQQRRDTTRLVVQPLFNSF